MKKYQRLINVAAELFERDNIDAVRELVGPCKMTTPRGIGHNAYIEFLGYRFYEHTYIIKDLKTGKFSTMGRQEFETNFKLLNDAI